MFILLLNKELNDEECDATKAK